MLEKLSSNFSCVVATLLTFILMSESNEGAIDNSYPLMCNIAAYAAYRPGPAKFMPENIDPYLCTHILYAHLSLSDDKPEVIYSDEYLDTKETGGYGLIDQVAELKKKNPSLKILFSLGGWEVGSVKFSKISESQEKRGQLAKSILQTIRKHNFDGVDIKWMYPNHRGGNQNDVENFVLLLKEVKKELKTENHLLVATMSGNEYIFKISYDLKKMAEQLDYVLLLSFDFHGSWDGKTGVFAPIRYNDPLNVMNAVEKYLAGGMPNEKILLGFATHGRTFIAQQEFENEFKLEENQEYQAWSNEKGFLSPDGSSDVESYVRKSHPTGNHIEFNTNYFGIQTNDSFPSNFTKEKGFIGFNEICLELTQHDQWTRHWDLFTMTPFATSGKKLISYDDQLSYQIKINYLKGKNLGGAYVWSLDTDDFNGQCYGNKYPLVSLIKQHLQRNKSDITLTKPPGELKITSVNVVNQAYLN